MSRQLLVLFAVAFASCSGEAPKAVAVPLPEAPPTPEVQSAPSPLKVPAPGQPVKNAAEVLRFDLWTLLTGRGYQGGVAIFSFVFGLVALIDGPRLFRAIVVASFAVAAFVMMLSQLESTWEGQQALAKYFVSFEMALFIGYATHKTWEGTQLLCGALFGLYLFASIQDLTTFVPSLTATSQTSAWIIFVGTLCMAAGMAMVHDRYGGPKVLGVIASLFGGSLVVSAIGYFSMFVCTLPSPPIHVSVTAAQVASVYEFWYMMVFPMQSQSVGLFTAAHKNFSLGTHNVSLDRVFCTFFWLLFTFAGSRLQVKAANRKVGDTLKARLLPNEKVLGMEGTVIKIEA